MKKKGYGTLTGNMSRSSFTSETTNVSEDFHCHIASLHHFPLASVAAGKYPSFLSLWIVSLYCGRFYFCLMAFLSCYCVVLFLKFMNLLSCSSMTSLSSCKTAFCDAPYPVFITYTIRLYWFSFTFFLVPSPSSWHTVSLPDAASAREVCMRHVGYLSMSESLPAFLSRYQMQPWSVFPFLVILWRILECLSLLPIESSWLWIYTLSIWCVHGQFAYVYFVCVSASLRKWSDHHSVLLGKLSLVNVPNCQVFFNIKNNILIPLPLYLSESSASSRKWSWETWTLTSETLIFFSFLDDIQIILMFNAYQNRI